MAKVTSGTEFRSYRHMGNIHRSEIDRGLQLACLNQKYEKGSAHCCPHLGSEKWYFSEPMLNFTVHTQ